MVLICISLIMSDVEHLFMWPETIKLLEENIGKTLSDINHSRILYDPHPRILGTKAKINKWDLIKFKSFCTAKETINKVKRQPSDWEKIIANEATEKGLIWKIYKQLLQLNSRKVNDPMKKTGQRTKQTFLQLLVLLIFTIVYFISFSFASFFLYFY